MAVLRFIFALGYTVVAAEMYLRVLAPVELLPRHVCATEYGIRGNKPSLSYWHTTRDYRINIRTNSKGLRSDEEVDYAKPAGLKRIILLGDSFGMGYGVSLEEMYLTRLHALLQEAGVQNQVINLSVSGHGNAEELIALREEGMKYRPDLVIVGWHGSDLEDNVRSDLFRLEGGRLAQAHSTYLPAVEIREKLDRLPLYRWMESHCHLYGLVREKAGASVKRLLAKARSVRGTSQADSAQVREQRLQYERELCLVLLKEMEHLCSDRGTEFLVMNTPMWRGRGEFRSLFPLPDEEAKSRFHYYCPISDFKQHPGQILYWERSDCHYSPVGCRIVADGLAKFILGHGLLSGPKRDVE